MEASSLVPDAVLAANARVARLLIDAKPDSLPYLPTHPCSLNVFLFAKGRYVDKVVVLLVCTSFLPEDPFLQRRCCIACHRQLFSYAGAAEVCKPCSLRSAV